MVLVANTGTLQQSAKQKPNGILGGVSMDLVGSSSVESDPVVTGQISRLLTPRARAMEPGRDLHLHRGI